MPVIFSGFYLLFQGLIRRFFRLWDYNSETVRAILKINQPQGLVDKGGFIKIENKKKDILHTIAKKLWKITVIETSARV